MIEDVFFSDSLSYLNSSNTSDNVCFDRLDDIVFTAYTLIYIVLFFPLCIFILCHGLQQWKQKRSSLRISHSDFLTYHAVFMELIGLLGCIVDYSTINNREKYVFIIASVFLNINWCGQICFHILTCVERYLAVVHPITYLSLKNEKGIRIRNISVVCVWLLCFSGVGLSLTEQSFTITSVSFLVMALTAISFCSVSILCVLNGPSPGDQVGGQEKTDQVKQRAFYTIVTILGVLVLRFSFGLIQITFMILNVNSIETCKIEEFGMWLSIPSSLILPFLFLQRAGKMECFKRKQNPPPQ